MNRRKEMDYPETKGLHFEKERERKFLLFRISGEEYAMDLSYVREVIKVQKIKSIPQSLEFIEGVISIRGYLIALMNLAKRLHLEESNVPKQKVIICQSQGRVFGFLVEELGEILSIPQERIKPVPEIIFKRKGNELISEITQMEGRMIPLINLERMFT